MAAEIYLRTGKINTRKENWDSYDYMNKRIIEELDR